MILYTPLPPESVLDGLESHRPDYRELDYPGGKMIVEMISHYQGRLVRLISPCPQDYLHPGYQPGTIISFKPDPSWSQLAGGFPQKPLP